MMQKILKIAHYLFTVIKIFAQSESAKPRLRFKESLHNSRLFKENHSYKILGTTITAWGTKHNINFNLDPVSGVKISNIWPSCLIRPHSLKGFDIKYLWEISRFQFIPYIFEETEFLGIKNVIEKFRKESVIGFGPNWMCTMDVAIRAVNLCEYLDILYGKELLSRRDCNRYSKFIYQHFLYIYNNLEKNKSGYSGNHYLSNLTALIILGNRFEKSKRNISIVRYAIAELDRELDIQFNFDGTYFENSTKYHHLATEMLFYMLEITDKFADTVSSNELKDFYSLPRSSSVFEIPKLKVLLGKSVNFLHDISPQGFPMVIIGDNDSGRFVNLDYLENGDELSAATLINRIRLRTGGQAPDIEYHSIEPSSKLPLLSDSDNGKFFPVEIEGFYKVVYPNFGLAIFRGINFFLTIRLGHDNRKVVHAHEDIMSVNLIINGKIFLWDPGMPTYTRDRDLRNEFRFANAHNGPLKTWSEGLNLRTFEFKTAEWPVSDIWDSKLNQYNVVVAKANSNVIRAVRFFSNGILINDIGSEKLDDYLCLKEGISLRYGEIIDNLKNENFTCTRGVSSI